ncbi:DUF6573 family protein [Prescottella equi]|uniref:DUF6573 family protein n=1 Tax=Rhodococcus hoagii TaxID=43767 RepID=UPI001C766B3E|nr:DUF6573 family protein [Prescottella equi]BCN51556.1 hypothetical protein RE9416_48570 [Prescottella equi]BCN56577.1 hypothetical protein RE9425_49670 [Prescottella equi]BCN61491.1 hypothetical protein RE9427_48610 [Prescottella equi]BCN86294.1 hypothetical protein RE0356_49350 [Prescottella equi]
MTESLTDFFGPLIASYSRAQAIEDGVLHDVTDAAREHGILLPTAIAAHAWAAAVDWPNPHTASEYEASRAWSVLVYASNALRRAKRLGREGMQEFTFVPAPDLDDTEEDIEVTLGIEVGPGDAGEPVLTITAVADR